MIENVNILPKRHSIALNVNKNATPIRKTSPQVCNDFNKNALKYPSVDNLRAYNVSFGANEKDKYKEKLNTLLSDFTAPAEDFMDGVVRVAKNFKTKEINQLHLFYYTLQKLVEYINMVQNDLIKPNDYNPGFTEIVRTYQEKFGKNTFEDKKTNEIILPILKETIENVEEKLKAMPSAKAGKSPVFSKDFVSDLYENIYSVSTEAIDEQDSRVSIENIINSGIFGSTDYKIINEVYNPFTFKIYSKIMEDDVSLNMPHVETYDEYARNILLNLGTGTNMFVLHEDSASPKFMISSLKKLLNSDKQFGAFNKNNTDITLLNKSANYNFLAYKSLKLEENKDKHHIIVYDASTMQQNHGTNRIEFHEDMLNVMMNENSNVKFVVIIDKAIYDAYMSASLSPTGEPKLFEMFGESSLPVLTMEQMKKAFKKEPMLLSVVKKDFSAKALDYVVTATAAKKGHYPDKVINVMNKIVSTYPDKKEISLADVKNYIKIRPDLFRNNVDTGAISIVFDTGVRLRDMLGAKSTKAEIDSIIKQIRHKSIGTKGFIIYPQDGNPGGGRKFSAKVIAGETKSPYMEINALDFGTDEVALLSGTSSTPEKEMKSLFAMLKSQAETSLYKSAVLFIENFECFTSEQYSSEYQQKAMAQLLREMEAAQQQGLNIIVFGSVGSDGAIGEATMKSFKFVDKIEVESVAVNEEARIEIIKNYLKNNHIKLTQCSSEEEDKLLKNFAETTNYFSFIELMTLMGKVKNLLKERNHKTLNKSDFIEAFLQITSGRPSSCAQPSYSKKIVASHECGHAINLAIMYKLAENQNIPWYLPDKVNFITLDPRSVFGGAMFHSESENNQISYEKIFAKIVCAYGGHSCEKLLYNMDGSWGITSDLKNATSNAYEASAYMGQGFHYGKKSLAAAPFLSENAKNSIDEDVRIITENALLVSDLITKNYMGFIKEFTNKYADRVGSGDCIVTSEEFEDALNTWKKHQSSKKRAELAKLNNKILNIIKDSKNGIYFKR